MIDHISLRVRDVSAAKEFYKKALAPLGYEVLMEFPNAVGMGADRKPDLWITPGGIEGGTTHLAFRTRDNGVVDAFHQAALEAGGRDNGVPGIRHEYHPEYYGAFILDPDGNNLEVVCHGTRLQQAEEAAKAARRAVKKAVKKLAKAAKKLAKPKKGAKKKKR